MIPVLVQSITASKLGVFVRKQRTVCGVWVWMLSIYTRFIGRNEITKSRKVGPKLRSWWKKEKYATLVFPTLPWNKFSVPNEFIQSHPCSLSTACSKEVLRRIFLLTVQSNRLELLHIVRCWVDDTQGFIFCK